MVKRPHSLAREVLDALFVGFELRFGLGSSSELTHRSAVFRTEPLLKPGGLPSLLEEGTMRPAQVI